MSISSVSSSTYSTSSSSSATTTKNLEKEIAALQKELAQVQADKTLDEKTKAQQVAAYQTQIQNLQTQMAKAQQDSTEQGFNVEDKAGAAPPPPPDEMDFENISDDDLKSYLKKMQDLTGTVPGMEDDTSVSDLTSDQLTDIRNTLIDMSNNMQENGQKVLPPPNFVDNLSDDDLKSLLTVIKESNGNILGIGDSSDIDIESLTDEQLNDARTALSDMQQQRFQKGLQDQIGEMMQSSLATYSSLTNNS